METKICSRCELEKPLTEFWLKRGKPRADCRSCASAYYKNKYTPEQERIRTINRHGLSQEEYLNLLGFQGGRCAICGFVPEKIHNLYIDHDHECCPGQYSCGECVRGLLCQKCNTGLGMFSDDLKNLQSAVVYLGGQNVR